MIVESLLVLALAATPGIPEVPIAIEQDTIWLGIQNDFLSPGMTDCYRTFGFNAGVLHDQWLVTANYSAFTALYNDRIDVVTGLVAYRFEMPIEGDVLSITPGVGYVVRGDYYGQDGQNKFHKTLNNNADQLKGKYEDGEDMPFVSVMVSLDGRLNDYYHRFNLGYMQGTSEGHATGGIYFGDKHVSCFDMYIGVRMEAHFGMDTNAERVSYAAENGMTLVYGISFYNVHISTSYNPVKDYGSGEITYSF